MGERVEALCFCLGDRVFAVDIACIREILRGRAVTAVPGGPARLEGVMNLRGELIPVFDLHRTLLGQPPREPSEEARLVVMRAEGRTVGALVDRVLEVVSVPLTELRPVPGTSPRDSVVVAAFRPGPEAAGAEVAMLLRMAPFLRRVEGAPPGGEP